MLRNFGPAVFLAETEVVRKTDVTENENVKKAEIRKTKRKSKELQNHEKGSAWMMRLKTGTEQRSSEKQGNMQEKRGEITVTQRTTLLEI